MRSKKAQTADIVVDLGYGDSGKGSITDFLSGIVESGLIIRFNGGSQAAHGIEMSDGRRHVFSQFGAGMFRPGIRTILSKHMLVSPLAMACEEMVLQEKDVMNAFERTSISEEALAITPFQRSANRLREIARGTGRHGSCGQGIGETASDALRFPDEVLRMRHLREPGLKQRLRRIQERKHEELSELLDSCKGIPEAETERHVLEHHSISSNWIMLLAPFLSKARIVSESALRQETLLTDHVIFEGAQGVLLDEWRGFHPFTTWSTTTFDNALALLDAYGWNGDIIKTGVIRAYATRHGAGPFPTEDAKMSRALPDSDNVTNDWQRDFRVGWLDLVAIRYAIEACGGIDALAITCLDRLEPFKTWRVCNSYETSNGSVSDLSLGRHMDLEHQERLTALLSQTRPTFVDTTVADDQASKIMEHAYAIRSHLRTEVSELLLSTGPSAQDKIFVI